MITFFGPQSFLRQFLIIILEDINTFYLLISNKLCFIFI